MGLREAFRTHLRGQARALELVDHLFVNPYITVAIAAELLTVSTPTARRAVQVLEDAEIVQEVTGRKWGRFYVAGPIYSAVTGDFDGPQTP